MRKEDLRNPQNYDEFYVHSDDLFLVLNMSADAIPRDGGC